MTHDRLIAAAPTLLTEGENTLRELRCMADQANAREGGAVREAIRRLTAAIELAKGASP